MTVATIFSPTETLDHFRTYAKHISLPGVAEVDVEEYETIGVACTPEAAWLLDRVFRVYDNEVERQFFEEIKEEDY